MFALIKFVEVKLVETVNGFCVGRFQLSEPCLPVLLYLTSYERIISQPFTDPQTIIFNDDPPAFTNDAGLTVDIEDGSEGFPVDGDFDGVRMTSNEERTISVDVTVTGGVVTAIRSFRLLHGGIPGQAYYMDDQFSGIGDPTGNPFTVIVNGSADFKGLPIANSVSRYAGALMTFSLGTIDYERNVCLEPGFYAVKFTEFGDVKTVRVAVAVWRDEKEEQ